MIYHSNSEINKNKISIGKNISNDVAILSYVSSPEITDAELNINIMYKENDCVGEFTPIQYSSLYDYQYQIDIVDMSSFENLLLTNKFYENTPLYYKETIIKTSKEMYVQVLLNSSVVNTGFIIENDNEKDQIVIYHNFSINDQPKIMCSDNGKNTLIDLSYAKVFQKVVKTEVERYQPYEYNIFPDKKIIRFGLDYDTNSVNVTTSPSRNGERISFRLEAECEVDYDSNQEYKLGIVCNNKYDAVFLKNYFREDKIKFVDPLNNDHYLSPENFSKYYNFYDILLVIGSENLILDKTAWDNACQNKIIVIDDHMGDIDTLSIEIDKEDWVLPKALKENELEALSDQWGKSFLNMETNFGIKKRTEYVQVEEAINGAYEFKVPENEIIKNILIVSQYTEDGSKIRFEKSYSANDDINKEKTIKIDGVKVDDVLFVQYTYVDVRPLKETEDIWEYVNKVISEDNEMISANYFILKNKNYKMLYSNLGFSDIENNNIEQSFSYIYDLLSEYVNTVTIKTPLINEFIAPRSELYENEYEFAGYEKFNFNGQAYAKKVINKNALIYIQSYTDIKLKKINSLKIYSAAIDSGIVQVVDGEKESGKDGVIINSEKIEAYLTSGITSLSLVKNKYCSIDNHMNLYKIEFVIKMQNTSYSINKEIDISYIPRKQYIYFTDILNKYNMQQNGIITVKERTTNNLNIFIKDIKTNKYYFNRDGYPEIRIDDITDNIVVEVSEVLYGMNAANSIISVCSLNNFKDCLSVDKNIKEYQIWSPLIKNFDFSVEYENLIYKYRTPDFENQYFIEGNIKHISHEKATVKDFSILETQRKNLCEDQIRVKEERLKKIIDHAFCSENTIDFVHQLKRTYRGKTEIIPSDKYYTYKNIVVLINTEEYKDAFYTLTYGHNYLKVKQAPLNTTIIKYAPLTTFNNIDTVLCVANRKDIQYTDSNNVYVYEKRGKNYVLIDKNNFMVDEENGLIFLKTFERKNYYVSAQITENSDIQVLNIDYLNGYIYLKEVLDFYNDIYIDYLYHENSYQYNGYENNYLDLNPVNGHYCIVDGEKINSRELINKPCYIVLFPYEIYNGITLISKDEYPVKHTFNKNEAMLWKESYNAIILGTFSLTNNYDLTDISLIDCRSYGRGIKENVKADAFFESQFFYDIESQSRYAYNPNGFGVIKLPKQLLKVNGGLYDEEYIKKVVNNYRPSGCKYEIQYYDIFETEILQKKNHNNALVSKADLITEYFHNKSKNTEKVEIAKYTLKRQVNASSNHLSVRAFGAVGDGVADDTAAFQRLCEYVNKQGYGDIIFEKGVYRVSIEKKNNYGFGNVSDIFHFKNCNVNIDLNGSVVKIDENDSPFYQIFTFTNCTFDIKNGTLIGDRLTHDYDSYHEHTTHEWGYGIKNRGSIGYVSNLEIFNFTGDGILSSNYVKWNPWTVLSRGFITIDNCDIHHCRRQGITVGESDGTIITNTHIHHIGHSDGIKGTAPMSGIDLEFEYEEKSCDSVILDNVNIHDCSNFAIVNSAPDPQTLETLKITNSKINGPIWCRHANNMIVENTSWTIRNDGGLVRNCQINSCEINWVSYGRLYLCNNTTVNNCTLTGFYDEKTEKGSTLSTLNNDDVITFNNCLIKNMIGSGGPNWGQISRLSGFNRWSQDSEYIFNNCEIENCTSAINDKQHGTAINSINPMKFNNCRIKECRFVNFSEEELLEYNNCEIENIYGYMGDSMPIVFNSCNIKDFTDSNLSFMGRLKAILYDSKLELTKSEANSLFYNILAYDSYLDLNVPAEAPLGKVELYNCTILCNTPEKDFKGTKENTTYIVK